MADPRTDSEIIASSADNSVAFAAIFDRHFGAVYGYLSRRVGSEVGEDLASQLFLIAFDRRGTFDLSHSSCRPWLFGIATRLLRRHFRTERRYLRALARLDGVHVAEADLSGERRVLELEQRAALAQILQKLSRQDRETLLLFALAELTYEEISETLGVPLGTVRSRLNRCRTRLRQLLGPASQTVGRD